MDTEKKRREEQRILAGMVGLYCRGQGRGAPDGTLCPECAGLLACAHARTGRCPRMAEKTFCSGCSPPATSPGSAGRCVR